MRYQAQLEYKRRQVEESLRQIAGLPDVHVKSTIPSEREFAYRNKMEFSFSDRPWLLPNEMAKRNRENRGFALGLHVPGSFSRVIDIEGCYLQPDEGNRILREVKEYARQSGIPPYGLKTHEGFWRFLMVRYSTAFDRWMVNLVTAEEWPEAVEPLAELLCRRTERVATVVNNITRRKASIAVGEKERILCGEGFLKDSIGPYTFHISANSFFQTNTAGARKLYDTVAAYAGLAGKEKVLDLYSGTGTIPIFLAGRAESVTGIEINESAVADARRNCRENGIDNCSFICGDLREKLAAIPFRPDVLVIDPPRAGMHKDVLAQVLALAPERIVYVSCNPPTFSRDLTQMMEQYELIEVQPVDMFPHTYHIEMVAKLRARKTRGEPGTK